MLQRRYRFDGILINLPGRPPHLLDQVERIEKTADGELMTWRNGDVILVPWDDNAQLVPPTGRWIACRPTSPRSTRTTWTLSTRSRATSGTPITCRSSTSKPTPGPLDAAAALLLSHHRPCARAGRRRRLDPRRGLFALHALHGAVRLRECAAQPALKTRGKALAVLDRLTVASVTWAVAQAEHGVDAVLISSAFAGGPLISPRMYRRFVLPFEQRVTDAVRATGVPVYTHTCGSHRRPPGTDGGDRHRGHRHPGPAAARQRRTGRRQAPDRRPLLYQGQHERRRTAPGHDARSRSSPTPPIASSPASPAAATFSARPAPWRRGSSRGSSSSSPRLPSSWDAIDALPTRN